MKTNLFLLAFIVNVIALVSFENNYNKEINYLDLKDSARHEIKSPIKDLPQTKIENQTQKDLIAKGKKLFATKTCIAYHKVNSKLVGPSLQKIAATYKTKNGNLLKFLKNESKAIVEPAMATIMHPYVESTIKAMREDDLKALVAYIESAIK